MSHTVRPATPWIPWLRVLAFLLLLGHAPAATPVVLNEFLASNSRSIEDEDGDRPDWIELFNPGTSPVNLLGWTLSDDPTLTRKWLFPAVSIPGKGFLVVFASGKDRRTDTTRLHTDFKIAREAGGYLALGDSAGVAVSELRDCPDQLANVSFGRSAANPDVVGYFPTPTPGKPNSGSGPGFAPPVDFSATSQTYRGTLTVALSTTNPAAAIVYTTDGSMPSAASTPYVAPLILTNAVQVRAQSLQEGLLPGPVRSETFIPLSDGAAGFTSDLPVLLIHHFDRGRPSPDIESFAHVQLFEPDAAGITSLTNPPTLTSRAGIATRGSSTEGNSKVSLKLEFQDELGFGRALGPLGMPADPDWVLYAPNSFEPILIHNPFAHQLSRDIGRYSPRTRFVEVYFAQKGFGPVPANQYFGIYVLEEKIKLDKERVEAPELPPGIRNPPEVTGGYLLKIDRPDPGNWGFWAASEWIQYVDPKEEEILQPDRAAQRTWLQSHLDAFGEALYGPGFRDPVKGYRGYIEVGSWIDHHLLNVLTFNVDALRLSAYFYKQRNGKLHFGPLWDFDRALYSTDGRDANPRTWRSKTGDGGTDFFNFSWWGRLFTDPDFHQQYIDRYQELRRNQFSGTNLWRLVDDLTGQVVKAQPREQARWYIPPRGGSYPAEIRYLKTWLTNRLDFMDRQFVRPPGFAEAGRPVKVGHKVVLSHPSDLPLYYTLDGTDPRRTGGPTGDEIAPGALRYSGPIEISRDVRIVVRARNPQHTALTGPDNPPLRSIWSGPVTETFVIGPSAWALVPRLVGDVLEIGVVGPSNGTYTLQQAVQPGGPWSRVDSGVLDGSGLSRFRVVPTPTPTFFRVDGSP